MTRAQRLSSGTEQFQPAVDFAQKLHGQRDFMGTGVSHGAVLRDAASMVRYGGGNHTQARAAALHDTLYLCEDRPELAEIIADRYGDEVLSIIETCAPPYEAAPIAKLSDDHPAIVVLQAVLKAKIELIYRHWKEHSRTISLALPRGSAEHCFEEFFRLATILHDKNSNRLSSTLLDYAWALKNHTGPLKIPLSRYPVAPSLRESLYENLGDLFDFPVFLRSSTEITNSGKAIHQTHYDTLRVVHRRRPTFLTLITPDESELLIRIEFSTTHDTPSTSPPQKRALRHLTYAQELIEKLTSRLRSKGFEIARRNCCPRKDKTAQCLIDATLHYETVDHLIDILRWYGGDGLEFEPTPDGLQGLTARIPVPSLR